MRSIVLLAGVTLRESARRRLFIVVPIITVLFVGLYWVGNHYAFDFTDGVTEGPTGLVDRRALAGSSLVGLSMFMTLFLSSVLGVFLTMSAVRGDAESGLLQPFVVRPVRRFDVLLGRFLGAATVAIPYAFLLFGSSVVITGLIGNWWPTKPIVAGIQLGGAVAVITGLSMLGSVFLSTIANGVVVFMIYGAGLLGGLLGQIGEVLSSPGLETTGTVMSWAFPFEALYQDALNDLTSGETGLTRVIVSLGPLGGAEQAGLELWAWFVLYMAALAFFARMAFARRDL